VSGCFPESTGVFQHPDKVHTAVQGRLAEGVAAQVAELRAQASKFLRLSASVTESVLDENVGFWPDSAAPTVCNVAA
jgi:hypothetical protein